jgi:hypothetical protein
MLLPLDGPTKQDSISVTTASFVEVKVGASAFSERKVITIQPLSFMIKVYFADAGETVTNSTVLNKGFEHPKKSIRSYEASESQKVYMIAVGGTTNVIVAERA